MRSTCFVPLVVGLVVASCNSFVSAETIALDDHAYDNTGVHRLRGDDDVHVTRMLFTLERFKNVFGKGGGESIAGKVDDVAGGETTASFVKRLEAYNKNAGGKADDVAGAGGTKGAEAAKGAGKTEGLSKADEAAAAALKKKVDEALVNLKGKLNPRSKEGAAILAKQGIDAEKLLQGDDYMAKLAIINLLSANKAKSGWFKTSIKWVLYGVSAFAIVVLIYRWAMGQTIFGPNNSTATVGTVSTDGA